MSIFLFIISSEYQNLQLKKFILKIRVMEQYIPKSVVVAKIYKLKKSHDNWSYMGKCFHQEYENLLSFIDTLEVKEVDLDYIKNELDEVVRIYKPDGDFGWGTLYNVATHFFELGLRVQKGE